MIKLLVFKDHWKVLGFGTFLIQNRQRPWPW